MKNLKLPTLLFLVTFCTAVSAEDSDNQLWDAFLWKLAQTQKTTISLYGEHRNSDDGHVAFGYFVGPVVRHKVSAGFTLGAAVKQIYLKTNPGFREWQRTELEATYKLSLGPATFDHRNRHEYFFRDAGADFQRYRSRLRLHMPVAGGRIKGLAMSNEFFYDERTRAFEINRFVPASITYKLGGKITIDTYYMWEHRRTGSVENHIVGNTLYF